MHACALIEHLDHHHHVNKISKRHDLTSIDVYEIHTTNVKSMSISGPVCSRRGEHPEIQGVKYGTGHQFFWRMAAVGVHEGSTIHDDGIGSASGWIALIGRSRQHTQEWIGEFTLIDRVQYGRIIGGQAFWANRDVVKGIDVKVAHIESGVLAERGRRDLHAGIVHA